MTLDIAGNEIAIWIPPLVAFVVSTFTSMGGVSGAFLLLPFQMSVLGFTSPAVSSTNQLYNIVAIPSGVWRYIKEGRMVWPLTWICSYWYITGSFHRSIYQNNLFTGSHQFSNSSLGQCFYISDFVS